MNLAVCVLVLWKWNCVRWLLSVITLWLFAFRLKKIYRWLRSGSDHLFCVLPCCFPQKATRKTDKVQPTELDVTALSDKSLRDELLERGLDVGPIVGECNPAHHCRHRSGHRDCTHCAFVKWQMQTVPGENWLQRGCCTKNVVALVVSKVAEIAYSLLDCLQTAFILWAVVKLEKIRDRYFSHYWINQVGFTATTSPLSCPPSLHPEAVWEEATKVAGWRASTASATTADARRLRVWPLQWQGGR